jgi:hypothetical protein
MPVLWAGRTAEGDTVSGIEPAQVEVRTETEASFQVLLESIEAKGAGDIWLATSALAAALATLNSGVDPRFVDVEYEITGQINGPSGGAILTIGTLAALRGDQLLDDTTMTGTIAPDGTIGMVGEIPAKLRAAAVAGFRRSLVPLGAVRTVRAPYETGDGGVSAATDLIEFGSELGVEVIEVGHLDEAYELMTGTAIALPDTGSTALDPVAESTVRQLTDDLVERCRLLFDGIADELPEAERSSLTGLVDRLEASARDASPATTYGLGIDVLQSLARADARQRVNDHIDEDGLDVAWALVAQEVDALIERNDAAIREHSAIDGLGVEQVFSLPFALGWFAYERGVLAALAESLAGQPDRFLLERLAITAAQSSVAITTFGPDAVAIVAASSADPVEDPDELASFMNGYVDFIGRSADYTAQYANVDGLMAPSTHPITVLAALRSLPSLVEDGDESLRRAVIDLADVTTEFVLGESVVSGESFGLSGFGIGDDPVAQADENAALSVAVSSGVAQARSLGSSLVENGSGLDYVLWQADLAEGVYGALDGDPRQGAAGVIALNELWYAVINANLVSASRNAVRFS